MTKLTTEKAKEIDDQPECFETLLEQIKNGTIDSDEAVYSLASRCLVNVDDARGRYLGRKERRKILHEAFDILLVIQEQVVEQQRSEETFANLLIDDRKELRQ
jgi:hypothetical protein